MTINALRHKLNNWVMLQISDAQWDAVEKAEAKKKL